MKLTDIGDPRRGEAAIAVLPLDACSLLHPRSVFVFGVRRGDPSALRFASSLARTLVERGARVVGWSGRGGEAAEAALREAGAEATLVAPNPTGGGETALDAFLKSGSDRLEPSDVLIAVGPDFPARAAATCTVALTAGLPLAGWSPAARSVRDRVDLQLSEVRPGVAQRLARRLSASPIG